MFKLYPNAFRNASLTLITFFSCITLALAAPKKPFFGQAPSIGLTGFDGGTGTSTSFGTNQASPFTVTNILSSGFDVTAIGTNTNVTLTATGGAGYGTASPSSADNRYIRGQRASAAGSFSELDFASDDGSAFNLQSMAVSATLLTATDQVKVVLTGYRSGTQVGSPVTVTVAASNSGVQWVLATTNFSGIDEVKVAFSDNDNPSGAVGAGGVDALTLTGLSVVNPALSNGQSGVAYTAENFSGSGGTSPYTFALVSGSLPAGMSLSSSGTLSGTPTAVGTFNFSVHATDATGQTSAADPVSLTITPPSLGLAPTSLSDGSYKSAYSPVTFSGSGGVAPYTYSAVGLPPGMSVNNGVLSGTPTTAGTFAIAVTVQDATTGTGSPYTQTNFITLVIDKVPLTVTVNSATKLYGAANPAFSATYTGFVGGDNTGSLTTQPTFSTTATAASPVGAYSITASGAVDPNYAFTYIANTLTVQPVVLTVTANNATMTYGGSFPTLGATYSGFVNGDNANNLTTQASLSVNAIPSAPVGTYTITPLGVVDPNYTFNYISGTLTITPASLTIQALPATMTYGSSVPALSASYSGFKNGDNAASLTSPPTLNTTAASSSPVGTYPITAASAVDPNYTISYLPGVLTVTPATLTVTADDKTMPLGGPLPALTVSYSGFKNSDNVSSLTAQSTASTTATAGSGAGTYPITPAGGSDPNYTFNYVDGTLTVQKAILTITANPASSIYGSPLVSNGALTVSYSGFINGDNSSSLTVPPVVSNTCFTGAPVGSYQLIPSGAVDPNYTIVYVDGNYTITPAPLNIQPNNATMTYGGAVPAFTASYTGFVNGDGAGSLTTQPGITTTATSFSPAGTYPITATGATDPNYTITYMPGILTIGPAPITVTANDAAMNYGGAVPPLNVTYNGFVNGDAIGSLTTPATATTTATSSSPTGTYPITPAGAVDPNYTFRYIPGTLTIGKAILTVTANNAMMTYGGTVPPLTVSYSGFVNGDAVGSLTTPATATTTATSASAAGTYPITPAGAADPNYIVTYTPGTLTIDPATLNVTANAQTKVYGTPDPALSYVVNGLVNGDNSSVFSGGLARAQGENVGTYPITEGTLTAGNNYVLTFTGNTLTITRAQQTISWSQNLRSGCNGVTQFQLTGSVNSGLPITYTSSDTKVATVSGDTLTLVGPGTSIITANQPGDANHLAAPAVTDTAIDQAPALVSQHWSDVLFFDNSSDDYVQWQWYKNGAAIAGATNSYYSESPSLNGQYYVIATNNTGQQIQTCPLTVTPGATIPGGIKVFPNPVTNGVAVNVLCNYTAAALQGAQMQIVDITGKVRQVITNVQPSMQVTMPSGSGIYIINLLLSNGQKASINVLVTE